MGASMEKHARDLPQLRAEYYELHNKLAKSQIVTGSAVRWDRVTAVASLIVAAAAFGLSVWQVWVTQNHNRLSVKPQVQISRYLSLSPEATLVGLRVVNNGFGPATVRGSLLNFKGKDLGPIIRPTWHQIDSDTEPLGKLGRSLFPNGTFLPAGERFGLLTLTEVNKRQVDAFRDLSDLLKLRICYCSAYDECWTATWKYDAAKNADIVSNEPIESCR